MDTPVQQGDQPAQPHRLQLELLYRKESRRILATLIRLLGDFDLAEEAMQEAFSAALKQWPLEGTPQNPRAWLISAGRFKAIDQIRKRSRFTDQVDALELANELESEPFEVDESSIADDQLRLIFTCCHPSLSVDAQLALTLREVCGLTTEQIARAFLLSAPTLAQRIVRAKAKIRDAGIPYEIPQANQLQPRLDAVLQVIYLLFNEGYSATQGERMLQQDLTQEAIHLCRQLKALLPQTEVTGLLALMLLQDSRRETRVDEAGDIILLQDQDRSRWDREQILEGVALVTEALKRQDFSVYSLQAAIAAVHAEAVTPEHTDWTQIVGLYDALTRINPSPVVLLNRAVAVSMAHGAAAGLELIERLLQEKPLGEYHLAHAAKADCLRRQQLFPSALEAYQRALTLTDLEPERRFLKKRIEECKLQCEK